MVHLLVCICTLNLFSSPSLALSPGGAANPCTGEADEGGGGAGQRGDGEETLSAPR